VAVDGHRPSFFANLLPPGGWNIHTQATAATVGRIPLCVLSSGGRPARAFRWPTPHWPRRPAASSSRTATCPSPAPPHFRRPWFSRQARPNGAITPRAADRRAADRRSFPPPWPLRRPCRSVRSSTWSYDVGVNNPAAGHPLRQHHRAQRGDGPAPSRRALLHRPAADDPELDSPGFECRHGLRQQFELHLRPEFDDQSVRPDQWSLWPVS